MLENRRDKDLGEKVLQFKPKLTHPKYFLSIILYWFCLFFSDEFDLDSLLNGGGISSSADVYQKLKVCCWFFSIFCSSYWILYLFVILQLFGITNDLRCLTRFGILGFSSTLKEHPILACQIKVTITSRSCKIKCCCERIDSPLKSKLATCHISVRR